MSDIEEMEPNTKAAKIEPGAPGVIELAGAQLPINAIFPPKIFQEYRNSIIFCYYQELLKKSKGVNKNYFTSYLKLHIS